LTAKRSGKIWLAVAVGLIIFNAINYRNAHKAKTLVVLLLLTLTFAVCVVIFTHNSREQVSEIRRLSSISLVRQPGESVLCSPAAIAMVESYYFGERNFLGDIFEYVANEERTGSDLFKTANYLSNRGLYTSAVAFSDLHLILLYLEENQIPAIMILAVESSALSHSVVFTGYDTKNGTISILDPADPIRTQITFDDLYNSFFRASDSLYGGNVMIIANDSINDMGIFICSFCERRNIVDRNFLPAIHGVFCLCCPSFFIF
jgi:hypothetical protein